MKVSRLVLATLLPGRLWNTTNLRVVLVHNTVKTVPQTLGVTSPTAGWDCNQFTLRMSPKLSHARKQDGAWIKNTLLLRMEACHKNAWLGSGALTKDCQAWLANLLPAMVHLSGNCWLNLLADSRTKNH